MLSQTGEVRYILHRVEDVTELVQATELGDELAGKTLSMERDSIKRSQELACIVKQSGGHIWVHSELGQGAMFKLYFPRVSGEEEHVSEPSPAPESLRGRETILLVEDNAQVRTLARSILRRSGDAAFGAANGGVAPLICEQHGTNIDLLLTDVVLPLMSGRQLAERL